MVSSELSEMFLETPTCVTYCDNAAALHRSQQLAASKTRTRRLSMRAAWHHHLSFRERLSTQYMPTNYQRADILTTGLSSYLHEAACKELCLQVCDGL